MGDKSKRIPMQVSDNFSIKLKEIQKKIRMKTGENLSIRDLTEDIVKLKFFEEYENKIINGDIEMELKIKMDRRRQ